MKKMMKIKKTMAVILTAAMMLGLSACGNSGSSNESKSEPGTAAAEAAKEENSSTPGAKDAPEESDTIKIGVIL